MNFRGRATKKHLCVSSFAQTTTLLLNKMTCQRQNKHNSKFVKKTLWKGKRKLGLFLIIGLEIYIENRNRKNLQKIEKLGKKRESKLETFKILGTVKYIYDM